jgi:hypothetical protein
MHGGSAVNKPTDPWYPFRNQAELDAMHEEVARQVATRPPLSPENRAHVFRLMGWPMTPEQQQMCRDKDARESAASARVRANKAAALADRKIAERLAIREAAQKLADSSPPLSLEQRALLARLAGSVKR